jgi:hypothetical protein
MFEQWQPKETYRQLEGDAYLIGTTGDHAWGAGEGTETAQGTTGDPIQIKGYWSAIDVRQDDDWKIRMLTWNITPAAPAETK